MSPNTESHGSAPHLPSGERKREEDKEGAAEERKREMPETEQAWGAPSPEERDVPLQRESRRRKREERGEE